jgi:SAM-dependent methyltransferase
VATVNSDIPTRTPGPDELPLVCPCEQRTATVLARQGECYECSACGKTFPRTGASWDLLLGERFNDEKCECMWSNEETTGRHLVFNYVGPLLAQSFPDRDPSTLRVLSIGCGVGSDVEALNELGYVAYGVDAGNRAEYWARRRWPDRYFMANARFLPFEAGTFDVIVMGCVLPHIGVGDDTYEARPEHVEQRREAADEMLRVTRKGGMLLLSSPNRRCPVDFFHRKDVRNHLPRLHSPSEDFLLSVDDYARLLRVGTDAKSIEVLPLRGYWGFYSSGRYLIGSLLRIPVRWYFEQVLSWKWTAFLRRSAFNPWLILKVER